MAPKVQMVGESPMGKLYFAETKKHPHPFGDRALCLTWCGSRSLSRIFSDQEKSSSKNFISRHQRKTRVKGRTKCHALGST